MHGLNDSGFFSLWGSPQKGGHIFWVICMPFNLSAIFKLEFNQSYFTKSYYEATTIPSVGQFSSVSI